MNYPGDYSALVTPGKYTVNFVLRFGDAVTAAWIPYITPGQPPPLANLPEPLDWQGTLRTGPVTVKVNPRMTPRPGSRPETLPDPANTLHLPPALVTKLFQPAARCGRWPRPASSISSGTSTPRPPWRI